MLSPTHGAARPRVLLVEDDPAVRRATQLLLSSDGYDVRSYASGAGLSHDAEALKASCLVADLVLPNGDAVTLLEELREAGWSGAAILVSGHLTDPWRKRASGAGYAIALAKPVADGVLKGWVSRLIRDGGAGPQRAA